MKKNFVLMTILILMSCGSSKTIRQSQKVIKGEWILNSINASAIGNLEITLLNDASKKCFENSTWNFIPNNNTGTYVLNGLNCENQERYFVFVIDEIDEVSGLYNFLLKPTDLRGKSETNSGFRMNLSRLSETDMQWQQTVNFEGRTIELEMNFIKL